MSKKKSQKRTKNEERGFSNYSYYRGKKGDTSHILGIDFTKNTEQRELIRLMNDNDTPVICCLGDAGTGKTFTAVAAAIDLVKIQRKYSKIYYIREPLEVGKSLGFMPGDLGDKYGVYLGGLEDNLENISRFSGINKNDMKYCIECIPPQFTRGRSWEDAIIIVDEAQNLSLDTIQTLVTRLGKYCKIVFLGSMNQIDIRNKTKEDNDFKTSIEILKTIKEPIFGFVELVQSERSEYCKILDEAFTNYKNK